MLYVEYWWNNYTKSPYFTLYSTAIPPIVFALLVYIWTTPICQNRLFLCYGFLIPILLELSVYSDMTYVYYWWNNPINNPYFLCCQYCYTLLPIVLTIHPCALLNHCITYILLYKHLIYVMIKLSNHFVLLVLMFSSPS